MKDIFDEIAPDVESSQPDVFDVAERSFNPTPVATPTPPVERVPAFVPVDPERQSRKNKLAAQQQSLREEEAPFASKLASVSSGAIEKGSSILEKGIRGGLDFLGYYKALDAALGTDTKYQDYNKSWLKYFNERDSRLSEENARLGATGFGWDLTEGAVRGVVELPPQLLGGAAGAARGAAVKGAALTAGLTSGLSQFAKDRGEGRGQLDSATYAALSGTITGLTTAAFGATGIESIFKKEGAKGVGNRVLQVLKQAGLEGAEEAVDQFQQDLLERSTRNPNKPIKDSVYEILLSGSVGSLIGGAAASVHNTAEVVGEKIQEKRDNDVFDQAIEQSANRVAAMGTMPEMAQRGVGRLPRQSTPEGAITPEGGTRVQRAIRQRQEAMTRAEVEAEAVAKEIGATFKPVAAVKMQGIPTEMAAQLEIERKKNGWEFTPQPGSPIAGMTFYVPEGANRETILKRYQEKVNENKPPQVAPPVSPRLAPFIPSDVTDAGLRANVDDVAPNDPIARQPIDLKGGAIPDGQEKVQGQGQVVPKPVIPKYITPRVTTKFSDERFTLTTGGGATVSGYYNNQDFPGEGIIPERGEIFLTEVPESQRGKGLGYSLTLDAIQLLKANGTKTVNMNATSDGGRAIVAKLIREGVISQPLRTAATGKSEYQIGGTAKPNAAVSPEAADFVSSKEFDQGSIHINLRGGELDLSKPLTGWTLPAFRDDVANAMTTKYGKAGLTAIFVPKEWVKESRDRPSKIKDGYVPKPEHIAVIPPEAIRPSGTVDWSKVFTKTVNQPTAPPEAAVPVSKKSTPRSDSQEFDRLIAKHGLEQEWVADVDGFYAEVGKYGDTASIEANKKKSKAYQAARRRAATAIGLKPDDVDTIQGRAKSLVKLKEYLAKLSEPDTLPDPEDANTDFLTPEDDAAAEPKPVEPEKAKEPEPIKPVEIEQPRPADKQPWQMSKSEWDTHQKRGTWADFTDPELAAARAKEKAAYDAIKLADEARKKLGAMESIRRVMQNRDAAMERNQARRDADKKTQAARDDYSRASRRVSNMQTQEAFIERAIARGETIPDEVMAEFPELKKPIIAEPEQVAPAEPQEPKLPEGVTVTRDKDFQTNGTYTVKYGTHTDKIFRDPENKWWYSMADFNAASKTAFPATPLSTENRTEAIQKLVERWKKPSPPTMRPLTKAEAKEFAELSRIARAGREAGGPGLNTEQTKRYQYLEGLAGAQDLPIEPAKPEEPKAGPGGKLVVPKGNLTLTGEVQEKPTTQDDLFANLGGGMEVGTGWDESGIRGAIAGEDTAGFKVNVVAADEAVRITGVPESRGYGGFFYKGQVYLVSNNIGRNNIAGAKRLLREEVGHGLLRTKDGLELLTGAIESGRINLTESEKQALRDQGYLENQLLDEFIAKSARENRSWWSDLVARTVRFLTGKGFKATNAEAARLLLRQIKAQLNNQPLVGTTLAELAPGRPEPLKQAVKMAAIDPANAAKNVKAAQASAEPVLGFMVREVQRLEAIASQPATTPAEKLRKAIAERTLKNRDFYRSIRRKVEQFLSSKRYTDDAVATYDEMKSELDVPNATQEQLDKMSNIAGNAVNELVDIENKRAEFNESYEAKRRELMGRVASSTESEMEAYEKLEATETIVSDFRQMALPILRQSNDVAALQAYTFAMGRTEAVRRVLDFIGHEVDLTGARTANDVERLIREAAGRSRIQEHVEGVVGASRDVIQAVARIVALVEPIRERLIEARYLYGQQAGTRSTALKERVEELVRAGNFTRALEVFERGAEKVGAEHDRAVRELNFYARRTRSALIALRALDETKASLDNIWNDPDFQAKRTEIFNRQGVASVTADLNGTTLILNAFPGQPKLKLVFGNDVSAEKSTLEQIREYKQNALAYIAGANPDPSVANGLKSTLPLLEQFLNSSFAPDAARLLPNWLLKGLNSAMTRVGSIERIPYYLLQGTGGAWRAIADASLRARRDMGEQLQRIHSEHFPKMGLKLHAALKSHGGITPDTYFDRVWNHLAASRQNFRDVKYLSEGDPIGNGEKVTKADLEYLEAYRKFHADLYNTSTNNGKRHFASFRSVLTGIFFDNNGRVRLPFAHGIDMVNRRAPSNTEISNWLKAWNNAEKSSEKSESKKAFLDSQFNRLVIGYMHGVNQADWVSKFKYSYETQIREVLSESNEQPIDSFDTLVDRVFEKAINEEGEAAPQTREDVENNLLSDFDAIFKRLARYDPTEKKTDPKTGVEIVMSETEFNTERGNVIMPPNWYDYGGVTEGTWASISRASMFPYERAHLAAMQGLQSAIAEIVKDFKTQATSPSGRGMAANGYFASRKRSRKSRERGELIYSWADAEDLLRKVTHYTGKLRAMAESPMLLTEMDRPNSILQKGGIQVVVSALLLRIPAMVRNLLGGYTNAVLDDMAFRSRSSYIAIPARAAEVVADVYKNTLTLLAHDGNPAGRALHKLLSEASSWNVIGPIAENLLKAVDEQRQLYRDSAELGLNLNVAFRDSMSVLWKFAKSGGSPREPGGPIAQWLSPVPTALRMGGLMMGQAGVGKVDSWINSKAYVQARQYEQVYKQMARKYGEQVAALGLRQFPPKAFGGEHQALRARDFFSRMSGLDIDAEMADYYKRWSEARAREQSEGVKEGTYSDAVDLLNDEQRNTLSVAAADSFNLATFANRPYSTKSSNTASVLGLLYGYVDWWLHKLLSLANTNSRKGLAAGHLENLPFLVFAGLAFALVAMMKDDAIKWLKEYLLNQKGAYPRITEAKTAPAAARAVAGAVAADFPVAGGMASKAFDLGYSGGSNPYDLILALGMAKNLVDAGVETFQTGDATIPAMRLTDRYFSPIPLHKLTDKMSGTRALINTGNILESQVRAQNEEEKLKPRDAAGFDRDYTPATPLITRAMNAIGNGDMPEFQKQYNALVEEYRKQGKSDPERNARQSLMTRNPISQRFAKRPSEAEFAKYLSGLTETERKIVTDTLNNYRQAMSSIGASPTFTSGETRGGSASTSFEPATRAPAAGSSAPIGRGSSRVRSSLSSRRRYPTRVKGVRTRLSAPLRTRRVGRIRVRRSRIPRFSARIRRPRRIRVSPRPQFV